MGGGVGADNEVGTKLTGDNGVTEERVAEEGMRGAGQQQAMQRG